MICRLGLLESHTCLFGNKVMNTSFVGMTDTPHADLVTVHSNTHILDQGADDSQQTRQIHSVEEIANSSTCIGTHHLMVWRHDARNWCEHVCSYIYASYTLIAAVGLKHTIRQGGCDPHCWKGGQIADSLAL